MSVMSEVHSDLCQVHTILLQQRAIANLALNKQAKGSELALMLSVRIDCLNDLLLEFEAAGIVWSDNVEVLHE
jgi:hypothetical protein